MTPDQLRKLAGDDKFIPGIYNYCDRWCERCHLSHRCLNYAMEQEETDSDPTSRDEHQNEFWDKLQQQFQMTLQMVREEAERRGIDLDAPEAMASAQAHQQLLEKQAAPHQPLVESAEDYAKAVDTWFQDAQELFRTKGVELESKVRMGVGRPVDEVEHIRELVEVIRWYQHFIPIKLSRAISSKAEEELETDPELKALLRDGDGSAKIALIALDRSLAGWTGIRNHFPEAEDGLLDLQVRLTRIRSEAEARFPQARSFVRPGFDDGAERLERGQKV